MHENELAVTRENGSQIFVSGSTLKAFETTQIALVNYRDALERYRKAVPALLQHAPQASHSFEDPNALIQTAQLLFDPQIPEEAVDIITSGLRTAHFSKAFFNSIPMLQAKLSQATQDIQGPVADVAAYKLDLMNHGQNVATLDEEGITPFGAEGSGLPMDRIAALYNETKPLSLQPQLVETLNSVILGQRDIASFVVLNVFINSHLRADNLSEVAKAREALRSYLDEYMTYTQNMLSGLPVSEHRPNAANPEVFASPVFQLLLAHFSLGRASFSLLPSSYRSYLETVTDLPQEAVDNFVEYFAHMRPREHAFMPLYDNYINEDLESPFALAEQATSSQKVALCDRITQGQPPLDTSSQFATLMQNRTKIFNYFQVPEAVERIEVTSNTIDSIDVAISGRYEEPRNTFTPEFLNIFVREKDTNTVLALQVTPDAVFGIPADYEGDINSLLEQVCAPVVSFFRSQGAIEKPKQKPAQPVLTRRQPGTQPDLLEVHHTGPRQAPHVRREKRQQEELIAQEAAIQPDARVVQIRVVGEFREQLKGNVGLRKELGELLDTVAEEIRDTGSSTLLSDVKSSGSRYQTARIGAGGSKRRTRLALAVVRSEIDPHDVRIVVLGIAPRSIAYDDTKVNEMNARLDKFMNSLQ